MGRDHHLFNLPSLIVIYFLLQLGSIKIDETSIDYFPWKRHYQIQWDNITQIETDQQGGINCISKELNSN